MRIQIIIFLLLIILILSICLINILLKNCKSNILLKHGGNDYIDKCIEFAELLNNAYSMKKEQLKKLQSNYSKNIDQIEQLNSQIENIQKKLKLLNFVITYDDDIGTQIIYNIDKSLNKKDFEDDKDDKDDADDEDDEDFEDNEDDEDFEYVNFSNTSDKNGNLLDTSNEGYTRDTSDEGDTSDNLIEDNFSNGEESAIEKKYAEAYKKLLIQKKGIVSIDDMFELLLFTEDYTDIIDYLVNEQGDGKGDEQGYNIEKVYKFLDTLSKKIKYKN